MRRYVGMNAGLLRMLVWVQARGRRGDALAGDEAGLSLLAYALGAAVIVAPLVILLLPVVQDAVTEAEAGVDAALAAS